MKPFAIYGAAAGALAGAAVWAALSHFAHIEVGYVAWGIGGLVGWIAATLGGRGTTMAVLAGAIALGGIFAGKFGAGWLALKGAQDDFDVALDAALYEEILADADALRTVDTSDDAALRVYIGERGYGEGPDANVVTDEVLRDFKETKLPMLRDFAESKPSRDEVGERWRQHVFADVSLVDVVVAGLGPIDIIFVLLGIATAFGIVRNAGGNDTSVDDAAAAASG